MKGGSGCEVPGSGERAGRGVPEGRVGQGSPQDRGSAPCSRQRRGDEFRAGEEEPSAGTRGRGGGAARLRSLLSLGILRPAAPQGGPAGRRLGEPPAAPAGPRTFGRAGQGGSGCARQRGWLVGSQLSGIRPAGPDRELECLFLDYESEAAERNNPVEKRACSGVQAHSQRHSLCQGWWG